MKLIYLLFIIAPFNFFYCDSIDNIAIADAIKNDDAEFIEKELDNGLDVDHIIEFENNTINSILSYAIGFNSEKIICLLINNGANVNKMSIKGKKQISPLFHAFDLASVEIIKLLIVNNADIDNLGTLKFKKINIKSIFDILALDEISSEKKQFVINYLIQLYDKNVLAQALSKKNYSLKTIQHLISSGAYIPADIIDIAMKSNTKDKKEIIIFLQRQLAIKDMILEAIPNMHADAANIISQYAYDKPRTLDSFLIHAIKKRNIFFIKEYLDNKGNPNLILKFPDATASLLTFALDQGAQEIANLLIENGADVNLAVENREFITTPLFSAFYNQEISIDFIKILLYKGAKLNYVYSFRDKSGKKANYNIGALRSKKIKAEKRDFIHLMLKILFKEHLLDFLLENKNTNLEYIKWILSNENVEVTSHTLEIAKITGFSEEIMNYLASYFYVSQNLSENNISFPLKVKNIITDYYTFHQRKKASKKCKVS